MDELKNHGLEDLYDILRENGINSSMLWKLTEEETKNIIKMNFGQAKRYWEMRQKKKLEKCLESGDYGNSVVLYHHVLLYFQEISL